MSPYESYISEMKRLKQKPPYMTEAQLHEAWGIKKTNNVPSVARSRSSNRNITPTLQNHSTARATAKPSLKINLLDIPKPEPLLKVVKPKVIKVVKPKVIKVIMTKEEKNVASLARYYATKEAKAQQTRERQLARYHAKKVTPKRVLYKDLTPEEIKERKKENKKRSYDKAKAAGTYQKRKLVSQLSAQELQERREYNRVYAQTPEQVQRRKEYRQKNKENLLKQNQEWRVKNPAKNKAIQKRCDDKRRGVVNNTSLSQNQSCSA
jgi:hypothetical protein